MRDPVILWFNNPPKVGKGTFNFLARHWGEEVTYVFLHDLRAERKLAGWDDEDFGGATVVRLYEQAQPAMAAGQLIAANRRAIHIVNGTNSPVMRLIAEPLLAAREARLIFFTERPVQLGCTWERIVREAYFHVKYRSLARRYSGRYQGVMALGRMGVECFGRYGWDRERLYPFMYCPPSQVRPARGHRVGGEVRLLYVGRFSYRTKGVDVLMRACELEPQGYQLDMVGGYGDKAEEVRRWTERRRNVRYLGTWPADEVGKRIQEYDAVVVPTRYDGWNLLVNEAVLAGVGVIVTNGAVSHEVIEQSGAGLVVAHGDARALASAIRQVVDHPDLLSEWQQRAAEFAPRISPPVVGQYMIDIIDHAVYGVGHRPKCPWIVK